jgi:predicted acetyltransferase
MGIIMIIRELRENELYKAHEAAHIAFNYPVDVQKAKEGTLKGIYVGAFEDDGEGIMSGAEAIDMKTSFYGEYIPTLGVANVTTKPEYRRSGCVRSVFSYMYDMADSRGWEISYLYPFSFNYYRQFGFERICDTLDLELPISALSFLPQNTSVKLYDSEAMKSDIISLCLSYGRDKNCLFIRTIGCIILM